MLSIAKKVILLLRTMSPSKWLTYWQHPGAYAHMGVTGLRSVHDTRSSRERIVSSNRVAHAMSNEQTGKYLASIKRLMTYARTKPSMKVSN